MGFYRDRRFYEGEIFDLKDEKHFSSKWMEKEDASKKNEGLVSATKMNPKIIYPNDDVI